LDMTKVGKASNDIHLMQFLSSQQYSVLRNFKTERLYTITFSRFILSHSLSKKGIYILFGFISSVVQKTDSSNMRFIFKRMAVSILFSLRSRGSVLAFGTQVRRFKPGRSLRIFRAKKSLARLPSEGK